jgi:hypothetical protein
MQLKYCKHDYYTFDPNENIVLKKFKKFRKTQQFFKFKQQL